MSIDQRVSPPLYRVIQAHNGIILTAEPRSQPAPRSSRYCNRPVDPYHQTVCGITTRKRTTGEPYRNTSSTRPTRSRIRLPLLPSM